MALRCAGLGAIDAVMHESVARRGPVDRWFAAAPGGNQEAMRHGRASGWFLVLALVPLVLGGCAGHRLDRQLDRMQDVVTPTAPEFLSGPAANLLTNLAGFSGRITVETPKADPKHQTATGTLLGKGDRLLFAGDKESSFIWNVSTHNGILVNEPLQGYAPVSASLVAGKLSFETLPGNDRVNGHPCEHVQMIIAATDGTLSKLEAWRATDLNGLAVRIQSSEGLHPFTMNLTDVRKETMNPLLFEPPDGFSKYVSGESMMAEMVSRQVASRGRGRNREREDPYADPYAHGRRPGID